jgi:UDPglucose 6-dehydrogenase
LLLQESVRFCDSAEDAIAEADVLVLITEWNEFRAIAPSRLKVLMRGNVIVDLRNVFEPSAMREAGLNYIGIGRSASSTSPINWDIRN